MLTKSTRSIGALMEKKWQLGARIDRLKFGSTEMIINNFNSANRSFERYLNMLLDDQYPYWASCSLSLLTSAALTDFLTLPAFSILFLCQLRARYLRLVSNFSTSSCFPHPT